MSDSQELEELLPHIEKAYALEIIEVLPVRRIYKLTTNAGIKGLKKSHFPSGRLRFMAQAIDYLHRQGFYSVASLFYTSNGQPFAQIDESIYYLVDWVEGLECDFYNGEDLKGALETLARFHGFSQNFSPATDAKAKKAWGKWPRNFKKCLQRLEDYKINLTGKKIKTPFDRKFLNWVDYFIHQGKGALNILGNSSYLDLCVKGQKTPSLCHHDVSARNFICAPNRQKFLIDLEFLRYDIRVYDLGRLICRTLFDLDAGSEKAWEMIKVYNQVAPLKEEEYPLLLTLAYFPQKFWRLADGYYQKLWSGSEEECLELLEAIINHEKKRAPFLADFSRTCRKGLYF